MLARRLLILLAVLMGLTALAAGVAPRNPALRGGVAPTGPSPTAVPSGEPARTIERTITAEAGAEPRRIVAHRGDTVILEVRAPALDSVSLVGLDKVEPVDPESPARFELLAETPGSYPIQLVESGREIGTLEIREPR